jgi:hypothetical protein
MNSLQLQIHIHGVPADFNTTVYLPCPIELVPWVRAANVNIPSGESPGVVLVCSTKTVAAVGTFNSLSTTTPLPTGATLEVVNGDTTPPTVVSTSQNPAGYPIGIVTVDGVRRYADGTCAKTAKEYLTGIYPKYAYSGDVGDGYYYIQTGDGPIKVWCDMTTDGGGWMCLGNYLHPSSLNAPADLDARDYAYFMRARNNAAYGRPEYYGDPNSAGPWTDWRPLANVTWPIEFAITLDNVPGVGWGSHQAKVIYLVKNRDVMPNFGTTQDLTSGDNLYYKLNFSTGWTDVGNGSSSGYYYWYPYSASASNRYLTLFHVSNYKYYNNTPTDFHYSIYYGSGVLGGNNTWHHSGRFYVR